MKIYTRTGDGGLTHGPSGNRLSKSDPAVCALGCLDELNSHIGLCMAGCELAQQEQLRKALEPIQSELLAIGASLASAKDKQPQVRLNEAAIKRIENLIDDICSDLNNLKAFILPGGCELACRLHVARTVCRRCERSIIAWADAGGKIPPFVLQYINRLSDLLFTLARLANALAGRQDTAWSGC